MAGARNAIAKGNYAAYCEAVQAGWAKGDLAAV